MSERDVFYSSPEWTRVRESVIARDDGRCVVGRLLGGACSGILHVHHIAPRSERPDLELDEDNCACVCEAHHPTWEAVRLFILRARRPLPPCRHKHPYRVGRLECDQRRAKRLGIVLADDLLATA